MTPKVSTQVKILEAFQILSSVSDASHTFPKDAGFCGPRGRIVLASDVNPTGAITATLAMEGNRYVVELSLRTTPSSTPLSIMQQAVRLAELKQAAPVFTPEDTDQILAALQARFGDPKSK